MSAFSFKIDHHLDRYGRQTRPTTVEVTSPWWTDTDIPDNIIFMYDESKMAIVKNIDTGERMIVFDNKPEGDKKKESRTPEKNRQRKYC